MNDLWIQYIATDSININKELARGWDSFLLTAASS